MALVYMVFALQAERCFDECVTGFRTKKLTSSEKECVKTCSAKFTKFTQRIASRFQELQIKMNVRTCCVRLFIYLPGELITFVVVFL